MLLSRLQLTIKDDSIVNGTIKDNHSTNTVLPCAILLAAWMFCSHIGN